MWVRLQPPGMPGKWTDGATGEHGDLLDVIHHHVGGVSLGPALDEARSFLSLPDPISLSKGSDDSVTNRVATARRLWDACQPLDDTHAQAYLRSRGIQQWRFAALRFHPELYYRDESGSGSFPGLVAAVTTPEGNFCGIHRTWLDCRAPAKAPLAEPRKALGPIRGCAVSLRVEPEDNSEHLVVGEGIETVLSVLTAIPRLSGAASLSAANLGAYTPPTGIRRVLVARDNDPAGESAAGQLCLRCHQLGIATCVLVPEHNDFNDDLLACGPEALTTRLGPLLGRPSP